MFSLVNAHLAYLAYLLGRKSREKRMGPVYSPPVNDGKMVGKGEQVSKWVIGSAAHSPPPF